ncbi:MAG: electron transport complex subunit RsxG [Methylohalobius crimeensis]
MTTVKSPTYRNRLGYHATLLGGMALLAGAALVLGDLATHGPIAERAAEDRRASLTQVIPSALHDNDLLQDTVILTDDLGSPVKVYVAKQAGRLVAAAFQVTGQGYGGAIQIMLGVDAKGRLLGVRVVSHAETPGLGDNIERDKSDWILGFDGLSLDNTPAKQWQVKKDGGRFDQFTGATITPRAVVEAVHDGLEFYRRHRQQLLEAVYKVDPN